jgi:sulfatase modifying factor 1
MAGLRGAVLVGAGALICIMHASGARADELCAAADDATSGSATSATSGVAPATPAAPCPADMVEIDGDYCPEVEQTCLRRPKKLTYRCLAYAPTKCLSGTTQKKHFCIDTYEWPNAKGALPVVMKSWYDARDACKAAGKRLCTADEWTFACEGPERLPYPYGNARDATACNIDKDHPTVDERALSDPEKRDAEVARLWQGEPSGARDRCVSPFGVHDMTGNVDEWTVNETGKPYASALKGGYWSWVRGRCRAVTPGHEESFRYYQIGFRCCADATAASASASASAYVPVPVPVPVPAPASASAPAPASAPASASAPAPASAPASAPPSPPPQGSLLVPAAASAHRVFLDGKNLGPYRSTFLVDCGPHVVKLGHDGRAQPIDVPCGGRASVSFP